MARNKTIETISADELLELQERAEKFSPEKLVIVAGPSFGTVIKFLLLGAALGAAGIILLRDKLPSPKNEDALYEGLSAGGAKERSTLAARAQAILNRAKGLAGRARDAAQIVAEAAKPAIEDAINQGRTAADQTKRDLESDISKEEA